MRYEECKALIKGSKDCGVRDRWGGRVAEAIREHSEQERELYRKMVQPKPVKESINE